MPDWSILSCCVLDLVTFAISRANVERAFSMFRVINRKKRAVVMSPNIAKCACIYCNKL